jgi:hypothetical protein
VTSCSPTWYRGGHAAVRYGGLYIPAPIAVGRFKTTNVT